MSNEQTAVSIRRVIHTELEACATAINRNDKKAALDQLSDATAKLKRLAGGFGGPKPAPDIVRMFAELAPRAAAIA